MALALCRLPAFFLLINRKILIFSSKVQMLLMTRLVVAFIHVAALLIWVSND